MQPQKMQPRNPFLVYGYANPRYFVTVKLKHNRCCRLWRMNGI